MFSVVCPDERREIGAVRFLGGPRFFSLSSRVERAVKGVLSRLASLLHRCRQGDCAKLSLNGSQSGMSGKNLELNGIWTHQLLS
jgi:hypothetical protein